MGVASAGKEHEIFTTWAEELGVTINGVGPSRMPGRGLGIVATKRLEKGKRLVLVPATALLKLDSDVVKGRNLPISCTVHGRLAATLTLESTNRNRYYRPWEATWPKMRDFQESMPLLWLNELQQCLPAPAKALLVKQKTKLEKDWDALQSVLQPDSQELFTYYWLIVNTRTFYWDYSVITAKRKGKPARQLIADDCMTLCPFADYFNHANDGCPLTCDTTGYSVTCDRDYEPGEEIYVTYGSHSNDFLLVEYGFILSTNKWDTAKLDHLILPQLSHQQRQMLDETGFLGDYTLDASGICYRTQAALRALILPTGRFRRFLSGADDGEREQEDIDRRCVEVLRSFRQEIDSTLETLEALGESEQVDTLLRRWKQIRELVDAHVARST